MMILKAHAGACPIFHAGVEYTDSDGAALPYPVVRFFMDDRDREIEVDLALDEAEAWLALLLERVRKARAVSP